MTKPSSINASAGLSALAALAILTGGCGGHPSYTERLPFEPETWRRGDALGTTHRDAPRLRMADGLVANRVLIGKSKSQVEAMLGPPTETDKFSNHGLVYWLGAERGFMSIDSEWLIVDFNAGGISTEAAIVRD